ncbi:MAG: tRNA pseudouridine(38-40) synthase TruA [Nitrospirae bacterium]|nr:MAG: tRNA pseudouridine(38-40) synthase TruA [Nitrospirota bacterium]
MSTFKLILEYDGTAYAGWQRQLHQPTIQAALESALEQITCRRVHTIAAGRTDAGVHALHQVVSFRTEKALQAEQWTRALNGLLPPDISVKSTEQVSDTFHARYDAVAKVYEYRIINQPTRPALERHRGWHIFRPLDVEAMQQAARILIGRHDFSSFQGSPTQVLNPICHLHRLVLQPEGSIIRITIQADRFLKQMVRTVVGTLVEIGLQRRSPETMDEILRAKDRRAAGKTAPPHGLYLMDVFYKPS